MGAGAARLLTCLIGVRGDGSCTGRDTDAVHHVCATCGDYLTAFLQDARVLDAVSLAAGFKQDCLNVNPVTDG